MATDQSINELLAEAGEALAEAGFRTGDFAAARDLAEKARDEAARTGDIAGQAWALSWLGMVAHYENITSLMSGSKPSGADIDSEEKLFRQALLRWQEFGERPAGEPAGSTDTGSADTDTADAGATDTGTTDIGSADTDTADAGSTDAGTTDTGSADTDAADAGSTDAGSTDAGSTDAGSTDAGTTDAGTTHPETANAGTAQALFGLGLVYQVLHSDWMTAMPYFWQALDLVTRPDTAADLYLRSEVHRHVGFYFLVEAGQPSQAVRHLQLSFDLREELADPRRIPSGLQALGLAELSAGNRERAVELLTRAVAEARAAGLAQQRIEDAEQDLREAAGGSDAETGPASTEPDDQAAPDGQAETAASGDPDEADGPDGTDAQHEADGPEDTDGAETDS